MSYNTTTRRYWINRKTGMVHVSKGLRTIDPSLWEEITLEEYITLLKDNAAKYAALAR